MATAQNAPGRIWEYRICMPMSVEEYHIAQLWSVAQASKNETGGGEGLEVLVNEPFGPDCDPDYSPKEPLIACGNKYTKGQYTEKIYHLQSKVPGFIRALAPKGSLQIREEAWNAYPYCRTVITNPGYMKEGFYICIESFHAPDRGDQENVHDQDLETLKKREVHHIDISDNSLISRGDYKEEWDPAKIKKHEESCRGPLTCHGPPLQQQQQESDKGCKGKTGTVVGQQGEWTKTHEPVMCCYKLVKVLFKWWGLQSRVEKFIMKQEKRIFTNFHRQVYCWIPNWYGLTIEDIRAIENKTKQELDEQRSKGEIRGTKAADSD